MHFFGTFAFSDLFLKNQVRRIRLSKAPSLHITPLPHLLTTARLDQSVECWTCVDQEVLSLNSSQAKSLKIFGAIMLSLGNLVQFIGSHLWWENLVLSGISRGLGTGVCSCCVGEISVLTLVNNIVRVLSGLLLCKSTPTITKIVNLVQFSLMTAKLGKVDLLIHRPYPLEPNPFVLYSLTRTPS